MDMSPAFQTRLASYLEQEGAKHGIPGRAIALTDRSRTIYTAVHGYANLDLRAPVTADTLFEIGSISKSFTAIALLQLHEAGRLDLHAPVTEYLPWWEVRSQFAPITLHHLLCHTAGIINGSDPSPDAAYEVWSLRWTEACSPPGARFHYSNVGYKALGLVLEAVYAKPYGEILRERVLIPLGMGQTHPTITHAIRPRMAVGYDPLYDDRPYGPGQPLAPATWLEYGNGDGSIASTASDMATYARMLLNRGEFLGGSLLTPKGFALLTLRAAESADEVHGTFYGYGLSVHEIDGRACLSHGGGMVGYQAHLLVDMDQGLGVVVLVNGPGEPEEIARFALRLWGAERNGSDPAAVAPRPLAVCKAPLSDYVGEYQGVSRSFRLDLVGDELTMAYAGRQVHLHPRGPDRFSVDDPDFNRYPLTFAREDGRVVEACHGPDGYPASGSAGAPAIEPPPTWQAFVGHYRSHNPWLTNFRVVLRKGALVYIPADNDEELLSPVDDHEFRVGQDPQSPERIRFETVVDGQALKANLSGCDYYRTFTP
jgi:CubicO group peptidase (beta-lactamase class C family)